MKQLVVAFVACYFQPTVESTSRKYRRTCSSHSISLIDKKGPCSTVRVTRERGPPVLLAHRCSWALVYVTSGDKSRLAGCRPKQRDVRVLAYISAHTSLRTPIEKLRELSFRSNKQRKYHFNFYKNSSPFFPQSVLCFSYSNITCYSVIQAFETYEKSNWILYYIISHQSE